MKRFVFYLFLTGLVAGCVGIFATNGRLGDQYSLSMGDENLTVFYTPLKGFMDVAVKNTGYAFMTNLNISFICVKSGETVTRIYSLGNLKTYYSKKLQVPIDYDSCQTMEANYVFYPVQDAGFANNPGPNYMPPIPQNPVEGAVLLK